MAAKKTTETTTPKAMTEQQWLKSGNAEAMNDFYAQRHTERKARLLMLASCQRHPEHLEHPSIRGMVDLLIAHYADPRKPDVPFGGKPIVAAYRKLERYAFSTEDLRRGVAFGMVAAAEPVSAMKRLEEDFRYLVYSCLHDVAFGVTANAKKESKLQAGLVREVLGNPFRSVTVEPPWLTDTVVLLARQIYETEDFSLMPILGDALQDAGCENVDVLEHCRDESLPHVRGCWVLDLILEGSIARETEPKSKPKAKRKSAPRPRKAKS
ncbi:MAG: hypothetical protein K8U57_08150 [Planctomycetes bacterium]|nr:hypothetical protein [Planctomycetota bacterium]